MKLLGHPKITKVVVSYSSTMPDVVFQRILFVETTIPLSQKQLDYDPAQLEWLIKAVGEYMEDVNAEKAEIVSTDWTSCVELKNPALKKS